MYTWMPLISRADLAGLTKHISAEYSPEVVAKRFADGMSDAVKGVLIEGNYIDKDYRSRCRWSILTRPMALSTAPTLSHS